VVDNEFNRAWNSRIIGLRFVEPPSYTAVLESEGRPDYFDFTEFDQWDRSRLSCSTAS